MYAAVVCFICGREFGTASIGIHIPKCQEKWENVENAKPKRERRPCPKAPEIFDASLGARGNGNLDAMNDAS